MDLAVYTESPALVCNIYLHICRSIQFCNNVNEIFFLLEMLILIFLFFQFIFHLFPVMFITPIFCLKKWICFNNNLIQFLFIFSLAYTMVSIQVIFLLIRKFELCFANYTKASFSHHHSPFKVPSMIISLVCIHCFQTF